MNPQEWEAEKIDRHLLAARVIKYGISYLDDCLGGILPNDLIVIGARTGKGKTELATNLAISAAASGRNVAFFALEADKWEIQRRMLYQRLAMAYKKHYAGKVGAFKFPRYRDWAIQGFDREWDAMEREVQSELRVETLSLKVVYKDERYSAEQFVEEFKGISQDTDLVIIDHLHYFDMPGNETEGIKRAVQAVRNAAIFHGKPVILLAHLRKSDRSNDKSLPDLEDFHGHSDVTKVATAVLLISSVPAKENTGMFEDKYPTYFHIAKARSAGEVTPFVGFLAYDHLTHSYLENYLVCRNAHNEDPKLIKNRSEIPDFFKRAMRPSATGLYPGRADFSKQD